MRAGLFVHGLISLQEDYTLRVLKHMLMQLRLRDGLNGLCQRENILLWTLNQTDIAKYLMR